MSSKRKSPPTKLDGSSGVTATANGITDLSVHLPSSPHHHYHPTQLDLSIKSESHESESRNYLNGDVLNSKRHSDKNQFHKTTEPSHSLQNLLAKRRKSENFHNDDNYNVPTLNSPPPSHHHHNNSHESVSNFFQERHDELQSQVKSEQQNGSDNEELFNNNNNNHSEVEFKRELMVPSKKTMNDVLKVLTNKMKGSSIKDSRKRSINECNNDDLGKKYCEQFFLIIILIIFNMHYSDLDIPENIPEREKYYLYSEMIHQLQMARDHLMRQQSEKTVS